MNTYQKVAKLRDETTFELKLIKREMEEQIKTQKKHGQNSSMSEYVLIILKPLFKLYEIEA